MALPYAFSNVTTLVTPQLDAVFNALGALSTIPCTAVGQDTIALTPAANCPTITSYSNSAPIFSFIAALTNTGATTINVSGVGAKPVYKANGATAIGSSDLVAGSLYYVAFNSALNSGNGGFVILNPGATASAAGAVQGKFKNLVIVNNSGNPTTRMDVTADAVAVSDGSGVFTTLLSPSVTINSATSGANGIDTGSVANSTWYGLYLIYNPTSGTVAGLMSTSFTSPTLPSGYTQFARVGSVRTNGSAQFIRMRQMNEDAQYVVVAATPTPNIPIMASGTAGAVNTPTWVAVSVSAYVPSTASMIRVSGKATDSANQGIIVAPNNAYGTNSSTTNPPILSAQGLHIFFAEMVLESTNIYWASGNAGNLLAVSGWRDNL